MSGRSSIFSSPECVKSPDIYHLMSADLRHLPTVQKQLSEHGLDPSLPTLVLSECALIYLESEQGNEVIGWFGSSFSRCVFVTYEQIGPDDAFGKMMINNLRAQNIPLHSLIQYPTLQAQQGRYRDAGFNVVQASAMNTVYAQWLSAEEHQRVNRLEIFDEIEEWDLIQQHYCLVVAINGGAELREIEELFQ